jgi:hypothetical protein
MSLRTTAELRDGASAACRRRRVRLAPGYQKQTVARTRPREVANGLVMLRRCRWACWVR